MALIHRKLANIIAAIPSVSKNATNKDDGYKFRSIYDIYNRLNPIFKKEGVYLLPTVLESSETMVNTSKGTAFRVKLRVQWNFHCEDESTISAITVGEGIDSSDKATNKALTSSLKYLLIYMNLIPTVPFEVDADSTTPTIDPFEKNKDEPEKPKEQPKSILALAESKGLTREDVKQIGISLGLNPDVELTSEERKKLFEHIKKLKT